MVSSFHLSSWSGKRTAVVESWQSLTPSNCIKWWETESVMQILCKNGLFHNSLPGFYKPGVCKVYCYSPEIKTLLTDMAVDMSFKWNVKFRSFCQPFFYHLCDVHEVLVKSEALYQRAVGYQQLWIKEAQGKQRKIQIDGCFSQSLIQCPVYHNATVNGKC